MQCRSIIQVWSPHGEFQRSRWITFNSVYINQRCAFFLSFLLSQLTFWKVPRHCEREKRCWGISISISRRDPQKGSRQQMRMIKYKKTGCAYYPHVELSETLLVVSLFLSSLSSAVNNGRIYWECGKEEFIKFLSSSSLLLCDVCNGPEYFEFKFLLMTRELLVDVQWRTCMWIFYCIDYNICSALTPRLRHWSDRYWMNYFRICGKCWKVVAQDQTTGECLAEERTVKWSIRMRFSYGWVASDRTLVMSIGFHSVLYFVEASSERIEQPEMTRRRVWIVDCRWQDAVQRMSID